MLKKAHCSPKRIKYKERVPEIILRSRMCKIFIICLAFMYLKVMSNLNMFCLSLQKDDSTWF